MKKLIATCTLLMAVSMVSLAQTAQKSEVPLTQKDKQGRPNPEEMAEKRSKMIQQRYSLNDAQYKSIYSVELDQMKQFEEMRKSGNKPGEGQMMQMRMSRDQRYKSILTPEQYTKFEADQPKPQAK